MNTIWIVEELNCQHIDQVEVLKAALTEQSARQYAKSVADAHCQEMLEELRDLEELTGFDAPPLKVVDGTGINEFQVIDGNEDDEIAWLITWREIEVV